MKRNKSVYTLAVLLPALILAVIIVGVGRYGSTDNLWRRIKAEFESYLPHPQFVPTPLPYDGTSYTGVASGRSDAGPLPFVTAMPDIWQPRLTPRQARTMEHSATPAAPVDVLRDSPTHPVVPTITASPTQPGPTPMPAPIATAVSIIPGLPPAVRLSGVLHIWQTWNNCGPATLTMALSYFGQKMDQKEVGAALRPNPDDKNVNMTELAAYAQARGLATSVHADGNGERLRRLLVAGVPVIIETWHEPKPNDGMGHYRLLVGYDDGAGVWIAFDSYDARDLVKGQPYTGIRLPYAETDRLWEVFNRQYLVIYDAAHAQAVEQIVGQDHDTESQWQQTLAQGQAAVQVNPKDAFAWFNVGSDLVALGRFQEAAQDYDQARQIGLPWRMLWYQFGPFRAYYESGRYDEVIALADATIATAKQTEEAYFWRGLAQKAKGDLAAARTSWQTAIDLNPHNADAAAALAALDQH